MPGGKGPTVDRRCDLCGRGYQASVRRLERGWDRFCSKSCANTARSRARAARRAGAEEYRRQNSRSRFKEEARMRAGYRCERCGKTQAENGRALDVHRVVPSVRGGEYASGNVQVLCASCHQQVEQN